MSFYAKHCSFGKSAYHIDECVSCRL